MTYILFISAAVLGLVFKKSKICAAYMLVVMILLAAFCYHCADIANYKSEYAQLMETDTFRYIGFSYLIRLSAKAGLSWMQYRCVFYTFLFVILYTAIKFLTQNANAVLSLYMITYYGIDVVQMKSHFADVISFFAFAFLIKHISDGKSFKSWKTGFSALLLALSALIHFSTAFYLIAIIVFAMLYSRKNMTTKMIIISIVILVAIYSGLISIIVRYANQLGILSDMRYLTTWLQARARYGYLVSSTFILILVLSCNLYRYAEKAKDTIESESEINILLSKFTITALMLIPLFILNTTYDRLMRVYILIALSYCANEKIRIKMSRIKFISLVFQTITIAFSFYFGTYAFYNTTLGSILKYNSIL